MRTRWARFKAHPANAWAFGARADVEARVNRMAQLFADGKLGAAGATAARWVEIPLPGVPPLPIGPKPPRVTFASTPRYVQRFFSWVAKEDGKAPV